MKNFEKLNDSKFTALSSNQANEVKGGLINGYVLGQKISDPFGPLSIHGQNQFNFFVEYGDGFEFMLDV